ncbi:hypothetical protein [Escherichia coli]|uniref:hypothetical protein n=1 Tax=Escherichia coli TaxID=562 RepID=UPI000D5906AC|nr:hypothetical protein [Escherichia coli]EEV2838154.1 hypothetical protein [Escherichia coli O43:H2]EKH5964116.1 hypothetical protein [Escherichia coli O43]AWJ49885.1 hypothetical protein I3W_15965 [Escherichia coli O43 str. RM10042]EEV4523994.1 hypothetical protein [Escherichia coli]EFJ3988298.1 hypothetical protein [Escherichia coli]
MELKDRIIQTKCENDPVFRERYLRAQVKPLAVVQDLMRRGCSDPLAQEEARKAINDAVDLLLLHPEAAHHIMAVVRAAHEIAREPEPKSSEPLNDSDLDQQIEDEF